MQLFDHNNGPFLDDLIYKYGPVSKFHGFVGVGTQSLQTGRTIVHRVHRRNGFMYSTQRPYIAYL